MIFLRIDLGFKEGLGHYIRAKSLINYLKIKKYRLVLDKLSDNSFLEKEKNNILGLYENENFINEKIDAQKFLKLISSYTKSAIVIKDSYKLGYIWEKIIFKKSKKLIVIDDFLNNKHYVDCLINHNPSFSYEDEKLIKYLNKRNKKNTKYLLGKNYALFNPNKVNKIKSDLVFYNGGSGNILIYEKVIKLIIKQNKNLKIVLIVGPFAVNYKNVCKKFKNYKNIIIKHKPQNISGIISGTKIFISSASTSMFEASFLKVPSLLFKMNSNQNLIDLAYEKLGHFFNLDKKDLISTHKIAKLIMLMFKNRNKIKKMMIKSNIEVEKIKKNYRKIFKFNNE